MKTKGMFIVLTDIKHLKECQTCVNIMFVEWKNKRIPWNISWSGEHRRGGGNCERKSEWFRIHGLWVSETQFSSVQFSSVAKSCPTLCDPMNHSTPGLPVHHHLPEFTQTHVHWVRDAIQPSHPRSSPSPPAPNPSQHQSLFPWVNSSPEVAKVLELQL